MLLEFRCVYPRYLAILCTLSSSFCGFEESHSWRNEPDQSSIPIPKRFSGLVVITHSLAWRAQRPGTAAGCAWMSFRLDAAATCFEALRFCITVLFSRPISVFAFP